MTVLLAAVAAVPVTNVGWTWAATMGAIQNVLIAGGGAGLGGLLIRVMVQLRKLANERAAQDDVRDAGRWGELMSFNSQLTVRVEKLEADLREERRRCDEEMAHARKDHLEEMARLRSEHAAETKALSEKMDGLQRMMIQNQLSTAQAMSVPPNSPKASESIERVGHHLRVANGDSDEQS